MEKTYKYRVHLTTWGIWINVQGNIELIKSDAPNNIILISDKFILPEQKEEIKKGLESTLNELKIKERKYKIEIKGVEYSYSDHQLEGFFWAAREWLADILNLSIRKPEITYDKVKNRYIFILS